MAHKGIAMLLVGLLVVGMFSAVLSVPVGTVEAAGSVPCPGSPGKITSGKESHLLGSDSPRPLNPCPGFEWAKTFGTAGLNDQAWGLDITSDGGAVVLIRTQSQGVTVVKVDGTQIEGYIFNRVIEVPDPFIQMFDRDGNGPLRIPYCEIRNILFTGKDMASGKSWEAWVERKRTEGARPKTGHGAADG